MEAGGLTLVLTSDAALARIESELELGLRYDGGNTSRRPGVELGGVSWELPSKGLIIDLCGRCLLDHEAAKWHEQGVSGSLRYDRRSGSSPDSMRGPSLSLRQEYGTVPASGGLDRLLSDSLEEDSSQGPDRLKVFPANALQHQAGGLMLFHRY